MLRDFYAQYTLIQFCVVDPDVPLDNTELGRIAEEIGDIWKRVGLKLNLPLYELNTIEADNPHRHNIAALTMITKWKDSNENVSQRTLYQAIEHCRGMYLEWLFDNGKKLYLDKVW